MAKYQVQGEHKKSSIEINGEERHPGDVLDESEFRPFDETNIEYIRRNERIKLENVGEEAELSELDSLLKTGHVVKID